jgi:MraZ protein
MGSLYGADRFAIDHKGRVAIPAKLRRALSVDARESFVVLPGLDGCLDLYPLDEWRRFDDKLRALPQGDARARKFRRMLLVNAAEVQVDGQGRVMLPAKLMELAGLSKEALVLGSVDHIEIWDPQQFAQSTRSEGGDTLEDLAKEYLK